MAYCTVADVIRLTIGRREETQNETPADLDLDQVQDAIADAEAQINLELKRRYVVPFVVVPDQIRQWAAGIAAYLTLLTFRGGVSVDPADPLALRYDRIRRMLGEVQSNKVDIDGAVPVISIVDALPAVYNEFQEPLFPLYPIFQEGYIPADKYYR